MMYAYCYEINELNVSFYPGTKLSSETDLKYPGEVPQWVVALIHKQVLSVQPTGLAGGSSSPSPSSL